MSLERGMHVKSYILSKNKGHDKMLEVRRQLLDKERKLSARGIDREIRLLRGELRGIRMTRAAPNSPESRQPVAPAFSARSSRDNHYPLRKTNGGGVSSGGPAVSSTVRQARVLLEKRDRGRTFTENEQCSVAYQDIAHLNDSEMLKALRRRRSFHAVRGKVPVVLNSSPPISNSRESTRDSLFRPASHFLNSGETLVKSGCHSARSGDSEKSATEANRRNSLHSDIHRQAGRERKPLKGSQVCENCPSSGNKLSRVSFNGDVAVISTNCNVNKEEIIAAETRPKGMQNQNVAMETRLTEKKKTTNMESDDRKGNSSQLSAGASRGGNGAKLSADMLQEVRGGNNVRLLRSWSGSRLLTSTMRSFRGQLRRAVTNLERPRAPSTSETGVSNSAPGDQTAAEIQDGDYFNPGSAQQVDQRHVGWHKKQNRKLSGQPFFAEQRMMKRRASIQLRHMIRSEAATRSTEEQMQISRKLEPVVAVSSESDTP